MLLSSLLKTPMDIPAISYSSVHVTPHYPIGPLHDAALFSHTKRNLHLSFLLFTLLPNFLSSLYSSILWRCPYHLRVLLLILCAAPQFTLESAFSLPSPHTMPFPSSLSLILDKSLVYHFTTTCQLAKYCPQIILNITKQSDFHQSNSQLIFLPWIGLSSASHSALLSSHITCHKLIKDLYCLFPQLNNALFPWFFPFLLF